MAVVANRPTEPAMLFQVVWLFASAVNVVPQAPALVVALSDTSLWSYVRFFCFCSDFVVTHNQLVMCLPVPSSDNPNRRKLDLKSTRGFSSGRHKSTTNEMFSRQWHGYNDVCWHSVPYCTTTHGFTLGSVLVAEFLVNLPCCKSSGLFIAAFWYLCCWRWDIKSKYTVPSL